MFSFFPPKYLILLCINLETLELGEVPSISRRNGVLERDTGKGLDGTVDRVTSFGPRALWGMTPPHP